MLEGLETVELKLSEVLEDNKENRLDPEYFNKTAQIAYLRLKHHRRFGDLVKSGYRVIYENTHAIDRTEGIAAGLPFFLQAADIRTPFISGERMICVSQDDWERYPKGRVIPGEVLIEVKGKAEKVAIVPDDFPKNSLITGTVYKMTVHDELDKYLLVSYLTSRHGQALKDRLKTNLLISFISKSDLFNLPIPDFNISLKIAIKQNFLSAESKHNQSKTLLKQAEQTLLRAMGLENWQPPEPLTYTRRASEAFAAGRLDSEHFQESYYALAKQLREHQHGCALLGEICPDPVNGAEIREYEEEGTPYLRVGDVKNFSIDLNTVKRVSPTAAEREIGKVALRVGDVLVSRSGSLAVTGVVEHEWMHSLISSHLIRVRIEDAQFDPYYVAIFLSTLPGKMQIQQRSNGGVQPEINQPSLKSILVPKLEMSQQQEIRNCIFSAHTTRRQAQALLEAAKRAVEIAIEHNEQAAIEYLAAFDKETY